MIKTVIDNPRYPHLAIVSRFEYDNPFSEEEDRVILYKGVAHSYTDTTTTGDEKMDTNRRKCSIPVRFDEWTKETEIHDGDTISVLRGELFETGMVKDIEPDNNRTIVYWELPRE